MDHASTRDIAAALNKERLTVNRLRVDDVLHGKKTGGGNNSIFPVTELYVAYCIGPLVASSRWPRETLKEIAGCCRRGIPTVMADLPLELVLNHAPNGSTEFLLAPTLEAITDRPGRKQPVLDLRRAWTEFLTWKRERDASNGDAAK